VCRECVCVGSVCEGVEVKVCRVQSFSRVILANHPGFSGTVLETDLVSCCPGSIENCPAKLFMW